MDDTKNKSPWADGWFYEDVKRASARIAHDETIRGYVTPDGQTHVFIPRLPLVWSGVNQDDLHHISALVFGSSVIYTVYLSNVMSIVSVRIGDMGVHSLYYHHMRTPEKRTYPDRERITDLDELKKIAEDDYNRRIVSPYFKAQNMAKTSMSLKYNRLMW